MYLEPKVIFRKVGRFSGPVVHGTVSAFDKKPTLDDAHLLRAFWLTTMVESGGFLGTIMMADGTALTAGLEQVVAVYPQNMREQGPLFKMLNRMESVVPISYYIGLEDYGWNISEDGVLRDIGGRPVEPKKIRDTFTPLGGIVSKSGNNWKTSKDWAIAFHRLFSLKLTNKLQIRYGIEQITKFAKRYKSKRTNRKTVEAICYDGEVQSPKAFFECPEMDLAMAMWWNYKTNAPTPALDALQKARHEFNPKRNPVNFAAYLINLLRISRYGRWSTDRYHRSRDHAMDVWPKNLFEGNSAIMPARKTR